MEQGLTYSKDILLLHIIIIILCKFHHIVNKFTVDTDLKEQKVCEFISHYHCSLT